MQINSMYDSRRLLAAVTLIALSSLVSAARCGAQTPADEPERIESAALMSVESIRGGAVERGFAVIPSVLSALSARDSIVIGGFPVAPDADGELVLVRRRAVIDGGTQLVIRTESGDSAARLPIAATFVGSVSGEPGSRALVCVVGSSVFGYIDRAGVRTVLGPRTTGGVDEHVVTFESQFPDAVRDLVTSCVRAESPRSSPTSAVASTSAIDARLLEVRVAVEADEEFYRRTGGTVETSTSYIVALWSMVSVLFEDEINVTFKLPWIKIWTTQDPYQVAGNGYALWTKAPAYWRDNYASVERDLAHIFTASDWGGGGIAFRGEGIDGGSPVICSRQTGYAMSSPRGVLTYPTYAFTYDAYIVAHETGHNFGARHTHECWWSPAIDTCLTKDDAVHRADDACHSAPIAARPSPGSIMSYCMGINQQAGGGTFDAWSVRLQFTPRVAAVMRREVEMSCAREPASPTIVLTSPQGRTARYGVDTAVAITWSSTGVSRVDLEYRADSADEWTAIARGVNAADASFEWSNPQVCATSVRVRVSSSDDPLVADTSLLPFAMEGRAPERPVIRVRGDTLSVAPGYTYRWRRDGVLIEGASTETVVATIEGAYTVTVAGDGGCEATSEPVVISLSTVRAGGRDDAPELVVAGVDGGARTVGFRLASPGNVRVTVVDERGNAVVTLIDGLAHAGWNALEWPVDALPSGAYWVVLRARDRVITVRSTIAK